jgi:predicted Zn-dependent peptidase
MTATRWRILSSGFTPRPWPVNRWIPSRPALDDELRKVITKGLTDVELKEAVTRLQDQTTYALDSLSGPAMAIGGALVTGSTLDDVEYWPYDLANVTTTQVQAVAFKYLNPDKPSIYPPVTGYLEPVPGKEGEEPVASPAKPMQGAIR